MYQKKKKTCFIIKQYLSFITILIPIFHNVYYIIDCELIWSLTAVGIRTRGQVMRFLSDRRSGTNRWKKTQKTVKHKANNDAMTNYLFFSSTEN